MATEPSRLVVLAGPTAVGKGTVLARVRELEPRLWTSVSVTTRPPRPGEIDGYHYHFISDDEFDRLIAADALLEWAVVHNAHRYGTPRAPVEQTLRAGRPALLELDLAGARQVRAVMPEALFVFLAPPRFDDLIDRLASRGTESAAERQRRLRTAREEMAAAEEFDVVIVNTEIERAAKELLDLISPSR